MTPWIRRLRAMMRRRRLDRDLREELAQHVEARARRLAADEGVALDEARRRAAVLLGNLTRLREDSREQWGFPRAESAIMDLRYGARQMRRTPLLTAAAALTLALTIGSTAALFAIVNAVILRPLPYRHSDRIMNITIESEGRGIGRMDAPTAAIAVRAGTRAFESVAAYDSTGGNLTGGRQPERVGGALVSPAFFDVMGVVPLHGRSFAADEVGPGSPAVIVLSYALWQRAFGAPADLGDRVVRLDDVAYRVIGVMPAGFRFPGRAEYWRPWAPRGVGTGGLYYTDFLGRLRPGVSPGAARDELYALRAAHENELPARARQSAIVMASLHESLRGGFRNPLMLLFAIVGCVLLIACANIANLLLARGAERRRELGLRTALGASRGRLVRQLLIESVLLALVGAVPGVLIAGGALRVFKAIGPANLARLPGIEIDTAVLLFTLAVTLGAGLLFGTAPAFAAGQVDPQSALKESGRVSPGRSHPKRLLVVFEIAVAVVLTIGAALLAKSFVRYNAVDRGFDAARVLLVSVPLPRPRYADPGARVDFSRRTIDRLRTNPGIASATHTGSLPNTIVMSVALPARLTEAGKANERESFGVSYIGAGFFRTFGIPLVAGSECPDRGDARLAVVTDRLARIFFPDRPALGESIEVSGEGSLTIVGVAVDVRAMASNVVEWPKVYVCSAHRNPPVSGFVAIRVHDGVDPAAMIPVLREAIQTVDPSQPLVDLKPLSAMVGDAVTDRWFDAALIAAFAALAIVLAMLGLYALVAYLVAQRTHEIGVRVALGAGRTDVVRLVLGQGSMLTAAGVGIGLAAALPLVRFVRSMLFEVEPLDPGMFALAALALAGTALLATTIPAWRAMRVDPIIALRSE
jgi:putative ABC transport system permease protein